MKLLDDRITENFRLSEFANTIDGGAVLLNPDVIRFVQMLQVFRNWYNRPVNISSGYRTAAFNRKVGGASNSYHLKGLAVDFLLPTEYYSFAQQRKNEFLNNIKTKWYDICSKGGVSGSVIYYDSYIHISWWPSTYFEDKRTKK